MTDTFFEELQQQAVDNYWDSLPKLSIGRRKIITREDSESYLMYEEVSAGTRIVDVFVDQNGRAVQERRRDYTQGNIISVAVNVREGSEFFSMEAKYNDHGKAQWEGPNSAILYYDYAGSIESIKLQKLGGYRYNRHASFFVESGTWVKGTMRNGVIDTDATLSYDQTLADPENQVAYQFTKDNGHDILTVVDTSGDALSEQRLRLRLTFPRQIPNREFFLSLSADGKKWVDKIRELGMSLVKPVDSAPKTL